MASGFKPSSGAEAAEVDGSPATERRLNAKTGSSIAEFAPVELEGGLDVWLGLTAEGFGLG